MTGAEPGKPKRSRKAKQDLSQSEKVLEKVKQIPESLQATYLKAMSGKSRRAAMRAFCQECVCYSRAQVRDCTGYTCPMYPYRPYQGGTDEPEPENGDPEPEEEGEECAS
jgi:hypothetical protein